MCSRYLIVTEGQTDGQTDGRLTVASSRGKNRTFYSEQTLKIVEYIIRIRNCCENDIGIGLIKDATQNTQVMQTLLYKTNNKLPYCWVSRGYSYKPLSGIAAVSMSTYLQFRSEVRLLVPVSLSAVCG